MTGTLPQAVKLQSDSNSEREMGVSPRGSQDTRAWHCCPSSHAYLGKVPWPLMWQRNGWCFHLEFMSLVLNGFFVFLVFFFNAHIHTTSENHSTGVCFLIGLKCSIWFLKYSLYMIHIFAAIN